MSIIEYRYDYGGNVTSWGWCCPLCGVWVDSQEEHICQSNTFIISSGSVVPTENQQIIDALARIEQLLREIRGRL